MKPTARQGLIACHACDVIHQVQPVVPGGRAHCSRCGAWLYGGAVNCLDCTLALAVGALLLFIPAMILPVMELHVLAEVKTNTVISGIFWLCQFNLWPVATFCIFATVLVPFINITALVYVLGGIRLRRRLPRMAEIFRVYHNLREWGMLEVYLLGVFVSLIKLRDIAVIQWGAGFYCFIGLLALNLAAAVNVDRHQVWDELETLR